jgi:hypothetical protein
MTGRGETKIVGVNTIIMLVILGACMLAAGQAGAQDLLGRHDSSDLSFVEAEFGSKRVYYHQRMIGRALVENDFIIYQFDKGTDQLLDRKSSWRDGLPVTLPSDLIEKDTAEALVEGTILSSRLYYISPESYVFPLDPAPENPCWVVRSDVDGRLVITIVDAVTGDRLGLGVPPPVTGFSLTGPWDFGDSCSGAWTSWMNNAATWFENMGYPTQTERWPRDGKVRGTVQTGTTAMFYELAHGGSDYFQSGCLRGIPSTIRASEIMTWITDYTKMPFAFIGSCGGMCETGSGTFAYEFRKGEAESTTVVGYCGMAETWCDMCWGQSISWQTALFDYMNQGNTVKDAFDMANADWPSCGLNNCMRFAGDTGWAVVPVVKRDPWPPSVTAVTPSGGDVAYHGTDHEITWIATDNVRVDSVDIMLSTDGGFTFPDTIATGEPNDSSFMWTVPDIDSRTARIRIVATDAGLNQATDMSAEDFTIWGTTSGVDMDELAGTPEEIVLRAVSGNPIKPGSEILFGLPETGRISLNLYDVAGRRVQTLIESERPAGYHVVRLRRRSTSGEKLGPGVYFIRLETPVSGATAKLVIAR